MSTTYLRYPAGYPVTVARVVSAGERFALETDRWDTSTSHAGWRRGEARYTSREEALEAARLSGHEIHG